MRGGSQRPSLAARKGPGWRRAPAADASDIAACVAVGECRGAHATAVNVRKHHGVAATQAEEELQREAAAKQQQGARKRRKKGKKTKKKATKAKPHGSSGSSSKKDEL